MPSHCSPKEFLFVDEMTQLCFLVLNLSARLPDQFPNAETSFPYTSLSQRIMTNFPQSPGGESVEPPPLFFFLVRSSIYKSCPVRANLTPIVLLLACTFSLRTFNFVSNLSPAGSRKVIRQLSLSCRPRHEPQCQPICVVFFFSQVFHSGSVEGPLHLN